MGEKVKLKNQYPRIMAKLFHEPWLIEESYLGKMIEVAKGFGDIDAVQTKLSEQLLGSEKALVREGVAHIPVRGPIFPRANLFTNISGATSVSSLARDFQVALDDKDVGSIVLDIDSPGGSVTGINEMADIIKAGGEKKDVTAYVSGTGASAAYWLATAANTVVIDATARVGSIGVVIAYPSGKEDDSVEFCNTASPNKRIDITTDSGKKVITEELDALADVFVQAVAVNRNTTPEEVVSNFGKGSVLVGQNAVDVGMADQLGSLEGILAEKSNLNTDDGGFIMASQKVEITIDSLKASNPDIYDAVKDLGKTEAASSSREQLASKDSEITELKDKVASYEDRLNALEKEGVLRSEREMKAVAGGVISKVLTASTIPTRLHDRIRVTLDYGKFVADGKLDRAAFSEYVASEVKDWEDNLAVDTIQGFGATSQDVAGDSAAAAANVDAIVSRMAAAAGQTIQ